MKKLIDHEAFNDSCKAFFDIWKAHSVFMVAEFEGATILWARKARELKHQQCFNERLASTLEEFTKAKKGNNS